MNPTSRFPAAPFLRSGYERGPPGPCRAGVPGASAGAAAARASPRRSSRGGPPVAGDVPRERWDLFFLSISRSPFVLNGNGKGGVEVEEDARPLPRSEDVPERDRDTAELELLVLGTERTWLTV